ncbi:hypothetical protein JTE90_022555 [Oedothorax gibbosus]|uniref:Chitin-binding type-2 domain-containing protein n=1 Tax=Oedothorax gibbosus TaxID=931172 RepID=A0AAV6UV47_9ARAC|nr:hypothetical protein JTE90_022555 [Oedothorax gibbosus]
MKEEIMWNLFFLCMVTVGLCKEETRKTLIIAVDETNPEKSNALISNLNYDEQPSASAHRASSRNYGRNGLQSAPIDKELGYIIVTPEELERLQNVEGLDVDEPRHISYPSSNSEESYDSGYPPPTYPASPHSDSQEYYGNSGERNRYPKQPAPPLSSVPSQNGSSLGYGSHYDPPPPHHYSSYGSGETGGSGAPYGNSPVPVPPYSSSPDHVHHYDGDSPPPKPSPYETYPNEKSTDPHFRPMYSGYKPPSTSYESDSPYSSGPKDPSYDYYSNPQTGQDYTKPHKSPPETKFVEPPYRAVGTPLTDTTTGLKNTQYGGNSSPLSYNASYHDSPVPNSYGSSSKYNYPVSPYTGAHSTPYTHSNIGPDQYSSKESSYSRKPYSSSYSSGKPYSSTYESENPNFSSYDSGKPYSSSYDSGKPYSSSYDSGYPIDKRPSYSDTEKYSYKSPKTSYSSSPGSHSYGTSPSYDSQRDPLPKSYRSRPLTSSYDYKYPTKPYSTSYDHSIKDSYDPVKYDTYGSKTYPSKQTGERSHASGKSLHNAPSSYKKPVDVDTPVVTRFYDIPTRKPIGYDLKYIESQKSSPPEKPRYSVSSNPLTVSKNSHLNTPLSFNTEPKTTEYGKKKDALRTRDIHSVGKNYKTSRPAPLHDEYEQPRYPPLPVDIPYSSMEKDSHEHYTNHDSKEQAVDVRNIGNSHYGKSYPIAYSPSEYDSDYTKSKTHSYYPVQNNSTYHSDHSSHEADNEPIIYTKTVTKTYSKPSAGNYYDHSSESPYNDANNKDSYSDSYYSPDDKVKSYSSSSQNTKPHSDEYSYSKPLRNSKNKFKYYTTGYNSDSPTTYSYETDRPQRVRGVVYRSRKTLPTLRSTRRRKNYLPYKVYNPEGLPAVDYKVYENAPDKNFTEPPLKNAIKLKYRPLKKGSGLENYKEENYDDSSGNDAFANIPGEAGKDFPVLKEIPPTYFSCDNRASGFYADIEHRCQVYHQCSDNSKQQSFLCPNGTIFNQVTFVCEWWHNVDCAKSEQHFDKNNDLYKANANAAGHEKTQTETLREPGEQDELNERHRDARVSKYVKPLLRNRRKKYNKVSYI